MAFFSKIFTNHQILRKFTKTGEISPDLATLPNVHVAEWAVSLQEWGRLFADRRLRARPKGDYVKTNLFGTTLF